MIIYFQLEQDREFRVYCGTKHWFRYDIHHRSKGPAIEFTSGTKFWYKNGCLRKKQT